MRLGETIEPCKQIKFKSVILLQHIKVDELNGGGGDSGNSDDVIIVSRSRIGQSFLSICVEKNYLYFERSAAKDILRMKDDLTWPKPKNERNRKQNNRNFMRCWFGYITRWWRPFGKR